MICILVASYLSSEERKIAFDNTLKSIAKNTLPPDKVLVSYSVREGITRPDIEEWQKILGNICLITFYHEERLVQFEHYDFLSSHHINDDDIIIFSDDDDILYPTKIQTVTKAMKIGDISLHKMAIFGDLFSRDIIPYEAMTFPSDPTGEAPLNIIPIRQEYFCFSVRGHILKKFFTNESTESMGTVSGLVDMIFREWLLNQPIIHIDEILVLYRKQAYKKYYNK